MPIDNHWMDSGRYIVQEIVHDSYEIEVPDWLEDVPQEAQEEYIRLCSEWLMNSMSTSIILKKVDDDSIR